MEELYALVKVICTFLSDHSFVPWTFSWLDRTVFSVKKSVKEHKNWMTGLWYGGAFPTRRAPVSAQSEEPELPFCFFLLWQCRQLGTSDLQQRWHDQETACSPHRDPFEEHRESSFSLDRTKLYFSFVGDIPHIPESVRVFVISLQCLVVWRHQPTKSVHCWGFVSPDEVSQFVYLWFPPGLQEVWFHSSQNNKTSGCKWHSHCPGPYFRQFSSAFCLPRKI